MENKQKRPPVEDWLLLLSAETEGDLMNLEESTDITEIKDAISILRQMSADDEIRQEAEKREKQLNESNR